MGSDSVPTLYQLQQPEQLNKVLVQDDFGDCTPCRVIGLGAYTYFSGQHQLRQQEAAILKSKSMFGIKARKAGITGLALSLAMMGMYRLGR